MPPGVSHAELADRFMAAPPKTNDWRGPALPRGCAMAAIAQRADDTAGTGNADGDSSRKDAGSSRRPVLRQMASASSDSGPGLGQAA